MKTILGFDPGRDKCGVAIKNKQRQVIYNQIIEADRAIATLKKLCQDYEIDAVVMGDGTTSKQWRDRLMRELSCQLPIFMVDEKNSTLEARDRYWLMYPPQGWQRLIPKGLRVPPRPVDDIVAILLVERYCD